MVEADRDSTIARDMERMFRDVSPSRAAVRQEAAPEAGQSTALAVRRERWFVVSAPIIVGLIVILLAVRVGMGAVSGFQANASHPLGQRHPQPGATIMAPPVAPPPPADVVKSVEADPLVSTGLPPAPMSAGAASRELVRSDQPLQRLAPAQKTSGRIAPANPCLPRSTDNNCIYGDVLDADHRLRAAYDDAVNAGAPAGELAWVNRQWRQARSISLDDPDETIRRYNALVRELDDPRPEDARP